MARSSNMRDASPKQLLGLCQERCDAHAFKRPIRTKALPACRATTRSPRQFSTLRSRYKALAGPERVFDRRAAMRHYCRDTGILLKTERLRCECPKGLNEEAGQIPALSRNGRPRFI